MGRLHRAESYKESMADPTGTAIRSASAGSSGDRGDGVEDSILTAEAGADLEGAVTTGGVWAAWETVGRGGRVLTVTTGVGAIGAAAVWVPETSAAVATGLALLVLVAAALVDAVEHRLPNVLVGAAAAPVVGALAVAWVTGATDVVVGAAVGAALVGGPLLVTHLASPTGMGFGDVKAGAVLGAGLGLVDAQIAALALLLGLSGAAGWALAGRRRSIALGPGLVAGAVLALLVARWMHVEANG
jgi:leader peptidase (prepilin peptidase) / N-methyltransferase